MLPGPSSGWAGREMYAGKVLAGLRTDRRSLDLLVPVTPWILDTHALCVPLKTGKSEEQGLYFVWVFPSHISYANNRK